MKRRCMAWLLALALLLAGAAAAEGFGETPKATMTLGLGESRKLDTSSLLITDGQALSYRSSNDKTVAVSADGVVTGKKKGKAYVAVGYDKTLLGLYQVNVSSAPRKVALSARYMVLSAGDTGELKAALPSGTASDLIFSSGNEAVATVDAAGRVTALAGGRTTVTVSTFNEKTATCDVYVLGGKAPTTLSLNTSGVVIQVGETFKLIPSVDEGSDAYYKFASQDKKIARVNGDGVITGVKDGITSVGVLTHNGLTQSVGVTVKPRLKEAYSCLTNEPSKYLQIVKKLKLKRDTAAGDATTVVCRDDELALSLSATTCRVALNDVPNPRYCIQGIDVSMTPEAAAAKLIANGWALTGTRSTGGVEQRAFTKDSDTTHYVAVSTADGQTISGISAEWTW